MEVLFVNSAVSNLIREGKIYQIPSVMQTAKGQGMVLLNEALFKLVVDKAGRAGRGLRQGHRQAGLPDHVQKPRASRSN